MRKPVVKTLVRVYIPNDYGNHIFKIQGMSLAHMSPSLALECVSSLCINVILVCNSTIVTYSLLWYTGRVV